MKPSSILTGDFSEQRWVDQISKNFDDEVNIEEVSVCVFSVPKSTSHFNPEAYIPLAIALGPYHHFETHLYQMERYKVAAVKAILSQDQVLSFESVLIIRLKEKAPMIRACYHKYMNLDDDTLAWIVAIDGLFLLGLFGHYVDIAPFIPKKLIIDGALYRDVMVLENQIPLYVLNEIWNTFGPSTTLHDHNGHDQDLLSMLREFCVVHSPLKLSQDLITSHGSGYFHLLDLMYHLIVNNNQSTTQSPRVVEHWKDKNVVGMRNMATKENITGNIEEVIEMGLGLAMGKKADRPIKVIANIPWEKMSNLLGLKLRKHDKEHDNDPPRITEVDIPSVSCLIKYGQINVIQTSGGIRDIKFDESKAILHLPVITLDVYSDVVLRNLIAYEVATCSSTPHLAQYIDLMSGIVHTKADAKLLRAKGIIKGNLNDKEIADLLKGMNRYNMNINGNKTIEQLNAYYNKRPMIKAWRFIKKDLLSSQKVVTIALTVFVCLLMILYSFCEVYSCQSLIR